MEYSGRLKASVLSICNRVLLSGFFMYPGVCSCSYKKVVYRFQQGEIFAEF